MNKNKPEETTNPAGGQSVLECFTNCGYHVDAYGNGDLSIEAQRHGKFPWLFMATVPFTHPSEEQVLDCKTAPSFTEGDRANSEMNRRLSLKQAELVKDVIIHALTKEFGMIIPSDEEIYQWRLQHKLLTRQQQMDELNRIEANNVNNN